MIYQCDIPADWYGTEIRIIGIFIDNDEWMALWYSTGNPDGAIQAGLLRYLRYRREH